jgi:hypothetical protein
MKMLEVFDPAMCCSTGVCGPQVDVALVRFAADLKWLSEQRVSVQRHNLSQSPAAFVQREPVKSLLQEKGDSVLPIIIADGNVVATGRYPNRDELCKALGLVNVSLPKLTLAPQSGDCCGGDKCC